MSRFAAQYKRTTPLFFSIASGALPTAIEIKAFHMRAV